MSVVSRKSEQGDVIDIDVNGRFDFSLQKEFRNAYRDHPATMKYRVNLDKVEYLDSAALGMLLLLRQHAGNTHDCVRLCNPPEDVQKILKVASFDRLFATE